MHGKINKHRWALASCPPPKKQHSLYAHHLFILQIFVEDLLIPFCFPKPTILHKQQPLSASGDIDMCIENCFRIVVNHVMNMRHGFLQCSLKRQSASHN